MLTTDLFGFPRNVLQLLANSGGEEGEFRGKTTLRTGITTTTAVIDH